MMDKQSWLILMYRFQSLITLLAIAFVSSHQPVRAADEKIITNSNGLAVEERPGWIEDEALDFADQVKSTDPVNGVRVLLISTQTNFTTPDPEFYVRSVIQMTNTTGLTEHSSVNLAYIPKYQTYSVTGLKIIRGDKIIDVLDNALVRFNQMEAPFGSDQFESPKQVMLFIPGLRVGDIIDSSYLIRGTLEAHKGLIFGTFSHGAYNPAGRFYSRLLAPKGLKLNIFGINSPASPEKHEADEYDEYRWVKDKISSSPREENAPSWYPSFPISYYSNFNSWGEVREWAEQFLISDAEPGPEIVALARDLTQVLTTETEKLRAALTFMQREIRYVGMELGRNGYRPFPVETVLERRFGDCKDKTNLLLAILNSLGIKAVPVLTNTREGRWMMTDLPNPVLFNHVFVRAVADGNEFWIDPTMPIFGDENAKLDYMNFGYGLMLDGIAMDLIEIPADPYGEIGVKYDITIHPGLPKIRNEARINIQRHLTDDLATYYRLLRDRMGTEKHDEYNQEFVAKLFEGEKIEQLGETVILDVYQHNELDTANGYLIHEPWKLDDKKKNYDFMIYSQYVRQYLTSFEKIENRVAPAVLSYPMDIQEAFHIAIPGGKFEETDDTIDNEYFHFNRKAEYSDGFLNITYSYSTKEKFIQAQDVETFNKDIKSIEDKLSYYFYLGKRRR